MRANLFSSAHSASFKMSQFTISYKNVQIESSDTWMTSSKFQTDTQRNETWKHNLNENNLCRGQTCRILPVALPHDWWEAKPSHPHRTGSGLDERLFDLSPACSASTLPSLSPTGRWQPVARAWTPPGPCCQQTSVINNIRGANSVERISMNIFQFKHKLCQKKNNSLHCDFKTYFCLYSLW